MFLDKLPVHSGWSDGWCFLCDILLRLPLSLFVKVVNVNRNVDKLEEFLKHPIKQHLLLKHLPMDLRQGLIYGRKYIFSVYEVVINMVSKLIHIVVNTSFQYLFEFQFYFLSVALCRLTWVWFSLDHTVLRYISV